MRIISQLFSLKTELLIIRLNNDFSMYNPSGSQPKQIKKRDISTTQMYDFHFF